MTSQSPSALAESLPTEAAYDHWVLPISIDQPGRVLSDSVRWTERGSLRCFFHGLLFDRELLTDPADREWSDSSDAALVLRAYERGGEAALSRLRGSFVVAIVDCARDLAIVLRDPLGSHPLFYVEVGSRVLFAAAPQALLDQHGVSRALNRPALADHLCFRWPDPQETFFAAVRRVLPGWRAVISGARLRLNRCWDPAPEDTPIQWLTDEEAAGFDELFERAVDRCLRNGPTAIFLSGGLDSISVAAVATDRARRIGQKPPLALSLGFPDPACDERAVQASIARELGLRQYLLDMDEAVGPRPLFEQALELNSTLSAPILNIWAPAYLALARRAVRDEIRLILTGEGGDEWLTVTPYLAADLIRRGEFGELVRFLEARRRSYSHHPLALAHNALWKFGLRPLASLALDRMMPKAYRANRLKRVLDSDPSWVAPDGELRAEQRRRAEIGIAPRQPKQGLYVRAGRSALDHTLVAWQAEERYQLGKRVGVRFLQPFWDPDLVEMLYRVPPRILNQGGRAKGLVRGMVARRFPGLGFEGHRKVEATSFYQSIILREGPAVAKELIDFSALSRLGVLDGRAASSAVLEGLKHPNRRLSQFSWLLSAEMWCRHYGN